MPNEPGVGMIHPAPFRSAAIPQDRLLPGIHGLRGIAALAVMLFHLTSIADIAVPVEFSFIASDFNRGVHLFFVLSAFSLMYSTEYTMQRSTWATEYFVKRFSRIIPLYYFMILVEISRQIIYSQTIQVDFETLLINITFMFGFVPWTGIVWAGWTVGIEMIFYCVFPVLLMVLRSTRHLLIFAIVSLFISHVSYRILDVHYETTIAIYGYNWAYFSFLPNLCFFAFGMYAFRFSDGLSPHSLMVKVCIPFFSMAILGYLMLTQHDNFLKELGWIDLILWGVGLTALTIWQKTRPSRWCSNVVFKWIGERSYSIYLLHPVVIFFLKTPIRDVYDILVPYLGNYAYFICALLLLFPLLALTEITYQLIEIPGIKFGQRVNNRVKRQTLSNALTRSI